VTYKNKIKGVHLLATKFTIITKMHGATHIKNNTFLFQQRPWGKKSVRHSANICTHTTTA
jgi:hypothetical protein